MKAEKRYQSIFKQGGQNKKRGVQRMQNLQNQRRSGKERGGDQQRYRSTQNGAAGR